MLYKVTPMMPAPETAKPKQQSREPGLPRKKRKSAIYDADGNEVLITLMCLKCKSMKPLAQFGLRKMADGAIRNQPWCRGCRGAAGTKKKPEAVEAAPAPAELAVVHPSPVAGVELVVPEAALPEVAPVAAPENAPAAAPAPAPDPLS